MIGLGLGLGITLRQGAARPAFPFRVAAAGDLMFAVDASQNATRTDVSSAVSAITAGAAGLNPFAQSTAGFRPVASSRSSQFDGTDDYLTQGNDRGTITVIQRWDLPEKFCCTGLGIFSNGDVLVGDHGRDGGGDPSPTPGVWRLTLAGDGTYTTVWHKFLTDLGQVATNSVQGVVVDPITQEPYVAIYGIGTVLRLSSAGALQETITGFPNAINGIFLDPNYPGHVGAGLNNSGVVSWYKKSDMSVSKTVTLPQTPDQLYFNPLTQELEYTYGTDAVSGNISSFSLHNNALRGNAVSTALDCIEGKITLPDLTELVCNDADFHGGAVPQNQLIQISRTPFPTGAVPGSRFGFGWAGQIPSTKASTGAVIAGGQASLTSAGTTGLELVIPTSSSVLQNIITQNQTFGFASSLLVWHYYFWDVNLTAKTIEYFIDGVSQGTTSITAVTAAYLTAQNWALGAEHRAAGPVTFGKNYVGRAVALINTDTWRAEAMAWLAAA